MKLHDLFEPYQITHINEVFDTKIPVDKWWHEGQDLVGELLIDNAIYHILLKPKIYSFQNKTYSYIDVSFAKFVNNKRVETLTFDKENPVNASKVIGAVTNAFYDKLQEYQYDAIVFIAQDNVRQRMSIYNRVISQTAKWLKMSYLPNISLPKPPGAKATIMFDKSFDKEAHDDFVRYVSTLPPNK